ncbi:chemotaxis protein, partial [Pseudomonas syringae pv. tagetis]
GVNTVLAGDDTAVQAAVAFGRDASQLGRVLNGMLEGNATLRISQLEDRDARARQAEIAELFEIVSGSLHQKLENTPEHN